MGGDGFVTVAGPAEAQTRVKASVFLAYAAPVATEEEARAVLAAREKAMWDANHHCSAWRLRGGVSRANDAGEPGGSAGAPILAAIDGAGLVDVVVIVARWFGMLFLLHAVGVHVGVGSALLYMVVTGLANTMPALPGNVGIYQGAAIGALAMAGHQGDAAIAASVFTPAAASLATAAAALVGLAFYGRHAARVSRAAVRF